MRFLVKGFFGNVESCFKNLLSDEPIDFFIKRSQDTTVRHCAKTFCTTLSPAIINAFFNLKKIRMDALPINIIIYNEIKSE